MFNRHEHEQIDALKAQVDALQARLDADISTLSDGDDAASRQALADASERNATASLLLSHAGSLGELDVARQVVLEGLTATRFGRLKQGLPVGPDLPSADATATPGTAVFDRAPNQPAPRTPFWQKAMAVGGVVLGFGAALVLMGRSKLKNGNFKPSRTARSVRRDAEVVKAHLP